MDAGAFCSGFFYFYKMIRKICFLIFLFLSVAELHAQKNNLFRYDSDYPDSSVYSGRRIELRNKLPDNSVAIVFSAPVRNRSTDVDYRYHQNPDFYYLTGFTSSNSLLLIFKDNQSINGNFANEFLFIPARKKQKELWTGRMASVKDADEISGIKSIINACAFDTLFFDFEKFDKILFANLPVGMTDNKQDTCDLSDLVTSFKRKSQFPSPNGDSYILRKTLSGMREIKRESELVLLRKAISISCLGHIAMMKNLKPGMHEYEIQSVGEYVFRNKGAEDVGYPSICGGAENSCILHYETNRRELKNGDLILLDMGAEYHGYTADVTRTLPVGGKFSKEQKIIYNLVRQAQDSAFSMCKPGSEFHDPHKAAVSVIKKGLLDLGIIKDEKEFSQYFMHGTSHYLGLDVHDVGAFGALKAGNVITIEPGIYITADSPCDPKWWNIGIRIEDDVLITATGYENLSGACPSNAADIEMLMKSSSSAPELIR